ncbi:MAG: rod shape-determining protein, partial [Firmicutes bacterium]|nr:rod shape-determining protein [Bacillota bacterium]
MIGTNICFDPGSANLSLWVKGKGTIISEPDIAAYDAESGKICALGKRAYKMLGKNHDWIDVIQPVRNGSVYDFQTMQTVLAYYIQKVCGSKILKPNILINVPAQATVVDKRNVLDLATSAGAAKMCIVESPLAAAVGAGVDCENSKGMMFVDIGAGTTDIA